MPFSTRLFNIIVPALILYFFMFENFIISVTANPSDPDEFAFIIYNSWWYVKTVKRFLAYQRRRESCSFITCRNRILDIVVVLAYDMIVVTLGFISSNYWYICPRHVVKLGLMINRNIFFWI